MKKLLLFLVVPATSIALLFGCKKSDDNTLAKELITECTTPFLHVLIDTEYAALPTAFSPNGDGFNDRYSLVTLDTSAFSDFHITIYQTNGTAVYTSNDQHFVWYGRDKNNKQYSDYMFYVKLKYTTAIDHHAVDTGTYLYLLTYDGGGLTYVEADKSKYIFEDQFDDTGSPVYNTQEHFSHPR